MATVNFNKSIVTTDCTRYVVRVHEDDGDATINNPDDGSFIEGTFYARSDREDTRRNSEKSLQWFPTLSAYIERLRNIEMQGKIKLRTGAIDVSNSSMVFFVQNVLRRTMVWVRKEGELTWMPAYCEDQTFAVVDKGEKKEYEINLTFGRVEYVAGA